MGARPPPHVSRRPGRPRSEQATTAILRAAGELLAEEGLLAMTLDAVAARAAVESRRSANANVRVANAMKEQWEASRTEQRMIEAETKVALLRDLQAECIIINLAYQNRVMAIQPMSAWNRLRGDAMRWFEMTAMAIGALPRWRHPQKPLQRLFLAHRIEADRLGGRLALFAVIRWFDRSAFRTSLPPR